MFSLVLWNNLIPVHVSIANSNQFRWNLWPPPQSGSISSTWDLTMLNLGSCNTDIKITAEWDGMGTGYRHGQVTISNLSRLFCWKCWFVNWTIARFWLVDLAEIIKYSKLLPSWVVWTRVGRFGRCFERTLIKHCPKASHSRSPMCVWEIDFATLIPL